MQHAFYTYMPTLTNINNFNNFNNLTVMHKKKKKTKLSRNQEISNAIRENVIL